MVNSLRRLFRVFSILRWSAAWALSQSLIANQLCTTEHLIPLAECTFVLRSSQMRCNASIYPGEWVGHSQQLSHVLGFKSLFFLLNKGSIDRIFNLKFGKMQPGKYTFGKYTWGKYTLGKYSLKKYSLKNTVWKNTVWKKNSLTKYTLEKYRH